MTLAVASATSARIASQNREAILAVMENENEDAALEVDSSRPIDGIKIPPKILTEAKICERYPILCEEEPLDGDSLNGRRDCDDATFKELRKIQKDACANEQKPFSCKEKGLTDCTEIEIRKLRGQECEVARLNVMIVCYQGGDLVHFQEVVNVFGAIERCKKLFNDLGCGEPPDEPPPSCSSGF
jgi:hypothetical protein